MNCLLWKGATIGVIAPGCSSPSTVLSSGIKVLENMGFNVVLGDHVNTQRGHTTGTPQDRATDINRFFADPAINAIIATRGGWNCNQILPYLDYDLIKQNIKPFLGLSDVSSILNAIVTKTGICVYHAPVLLQMGGGVDGRAFSDYSRTNFYKVFMQDEEVVFSNQNDDWFVYRGGKITGKLLGGNITSLTSIIGTPYEPDWNGCLLFWEAIGESIEELDQMLTHLKLAGVFEKVKGVLVGKLTEIKSSDPLTNGVRLMMLLDDHFAQYSFPVVYGLDCGHTEHNMILPIGGQITVDTNSKKIHVGRPTPSTTK